MDSRPRPYERGLLACIVCVAACVRLYDLSLMELRHDSAFWAIEGRRILDGGYWPLVGQQVGSVRGPLANGPLLSYLTAIVFGLFGTDPRYGAAFIAIANVAGVWLTYRLGRRLYSSEVGLLAAGLTAIAPWLVLYGRMLWPQSLFPFLVPLLLLTLCHALDSRRGRWFVLSGVLLGLGVQLHLSMLAFIAVTLGIVLSWVGWRAAGLIAVGGTLGYAPVLVHDARTGFSTVAALLRLPVLHAASDGLVPHTAKTVWNFTNVLSGQGLWASKLAHRPQLPSWIDWTQGLLFSLLLVAALIAIGRWRRNRSSSTARADTMLIAFVVLPTAYLLLAGSQIHRHYFLVLYPLPFLLIARGIDLWRAHDWRVAAWLRTGVAAGVALNLTTLIVAYGFLWQYGGEGGYGTVFADKQAAVAHIINQNGGYDVTLAVKERLPYAFLFGTLSNNAGKSGRLISPGGATELRRVFRVVETAEQAPTVSDGECVALRARGVVVLQPCVEPNP